MRQTNFLILLFVCAALHAVAAGPHLRFVDSDTLDLGIFPNTEARSGDVAIVNDGDSTLVISQAFTDCTCTKARPSSYVIAPGDTSVVKVTFDGHGRRHGSFTKIVRLRTNDAEKPVRHLIVKGCISRPWRR